MLVFRLVSQIYFKRPIFGIRWRFHIQECWFTGLGENIEMASTLQVGHTASVQTSLNL